MKKKMKIFKNKLDSVVATIKEKKNKNTNNNNNSKNQYSK